MRKCHELFLRYLTDELGESLPEVPTDHIEKVANKLLDLGIVKRSTYKAYIVTRHYRNSLRGARAYGLANELAGVLSLTAEQVRNILRNHSRTFRLSKEK